MSKYRKAGGASSLDKIHAALTDRLIDLLEKGVAPWRRTWAIPASRSVSTQKDYRGINAMILDATAAVHGYKSPYWLTFNQAEKHGGSVKKGERGTPIAFWKFPTKEDNEKRVAEGKQPLTTPLLRFYHVWNVSQCEGLDLKFDAFPKRHFDSAEAESKARQTLEEAQRRICPMVPGSGAFYNFAKDVVIMPLKEHFEAPENYYSVAFHEFVHATGHPKRLNRLDTSEGSLEERMSRESYAREELVAEIGSVAIAAKVGLDISKTECLTAAYIKGWADRIKEDPSLLITAAQQAQKATDMVLGIDLEQRIEEEAVKQNASQNSLVVSREDLHRLASYGLEDEQKHAEESESIDPTHPARIQERLLRLAESHEDSQSIELTIPAASDLRTLIEYRQPDEQKHFEQDHPVLQRDLFRDTFAIDRWLAGTCKPNTDRVWDGQRLSFVDGGPFSGGTEKSFTREDLTKLGVLAPSGELLEEARRFEASHVFTAIKSLASGIGVSIGDTDELIRNSVDRLPDPGCGKREFADLNGQHVDLSPRNMGCILVNPNIGADHLGTTRQPIHVRRFAVRRDGPPVTLETVSFENESDALDFYLRTDAALESLQIARGKDIVEEAPHFQVPQEIAGQGHFMGSIVRKGIKADLYMRDDGEGEKTPVAHLESGGATHPVTLNLRSHDTENPFVAVARKLALEQGLEPVGTKSELEIT